MADEEREARLKAQLRANLRRRKKQVRSKAEPDDAPAPSNGARADGPVARDAPDD